MVKDYGEITIFLIDDKIRITLKTYADEASIHIYKDIEIHWHKAVLEWTIKCEIGMNSIGIEEVPFGSITQHIQLSENRDGSS
jgi:hypothetical protein